MTAKRRVAEPLHADLGQRIAHVVKFERLDDCGNEFHFSPPVFLWAGCNPALAGLHPSFTAVQT